MTDGRFACAHRLEQLPPYLFAEIDRMKAEVVAQGVDVIDLGVGDPDLPTPPHVIDRLAEAARKPANHQYPSYTGMMDFREAFARYLDREHGVTVDPATETCTVIGAKEAVFHFPMAYVDPGDFVLIPDPAYPVYHAGTVFCGGVPYTMPLLARNGFLPDLDTIDAGVADRAKIMWLNSPNNPTAAVMPREFLQRAIAFAQQHNVILAYDCAYCDLMFDDAEHVSLFELDGGREVGIEFYSLSKSYNMTGWRLGCAVGNAELIAALGAVKTNVDSGQFQAVQEAGIAALDGPAGFQTELRATYKERRDVLVDGLRSLGWDVPRPDASFYVWIPVPDGKTSADMTRHLLQECGIVTTPGTGFGTHGEGYIRMTLCSPKERLAEAVERIRGKGF